MCISQVKSNPRKNMHILIGKAFAILLPFFVMATVLGAPTTIANGPSTVPNDQRYSHHHMERPGMTNATTTTPYKSSYSNHKRKSTTTIGESMASTFTEGQSVYHARSLMTRTSTCDSQTVAERSICPWRNDVKTEIPERSPSILYEARCLSKTPKDVVGSYIRCVPVVVNFSVKYGNSSDAVNTVQEPHAVGCTPVFSCRSK